MLGGEKVKLFRSGQPAPEGESHTIGKVRISALTGLLFTNRSKKITTSRRIPAWSKNWALAACTGQDGVGDVNVKSMVHVLNA